MKTKVKTSQEIELMRVSGKMLATVLIFLKNNLSAGMSTKDISLLAELELKKIGGLPAFLNYQGFPDVICISVNNEIVHGIPKKDKIIENGDIISLDFGVNYQGMITDGAISVILGEPIKESHKNLVENTLKSLEAGIGVLKNGVRVGDISNAVEGVLNKFNYGIVKDLVGHGVGHYLHEDPNIPNYGLKNTGPILQKNMTIAIEPMATLGTDKIKFSDDGWTVVTADNSLSAHFEHTVLITQTGFEILTQI